MPTLEVLPLRGAFPQLSPTGAVCVQTEGFWELKFLDATRQVWQDGTAVRIGVPPNGAVAYGRGVPRVAAGHGSFTVALQPGIVMNGTLELDANGGITRSAYNWMSPEGDVLWTTPYHADIKDVKHRAPNGVIRTVATFRHAEYVRMASGLLTFKGDGVTWWAVQEGDGYRVARVASVGEPTTGPVPLRTAEGWWVLEQYAQRGGYCLHPVDSTVGYRVIGIDTFNPDAVVINGEIWVVSQQAVGANIELRKFNLAEERVQLDAQGELDVVPPPRPLFTAAWHRLTTTWPQTLSVSSTLDFVTDVVLLERPSVIAPRLIDTADPSKVLGLLVHEPTDVADAIARARAIKNQWKRRHPTRRVPPVVCHITARGHEHDPWHTVALSDVDVWSIDAYFEIPFPADAEASMRSHLASWDSRLGADRPWIITYQAYDRSNASHQTPEAINEIRRLQPLFLQLAVERLHVVGIAAFSVNRPSGMVTYPAFAAQFERIATVCAAPLEIAAFGEPEPIPLPIPPRVSFLYSPVAPQLEPGKSVPVRAVATITGEAHSISWFKQREGDVLPTLDATNPASDPDHTFRFFQPGRYTIGAHVEGPGGADSRSDFFATFTITPKEGPALPSVEELSLDILKAADWLTYEVYNTDPEGGHPTTGRLIDASIDWTGYKQWLLHNYMRLYRVDKKFDHGTALTYTYGDIYHVLHGKYPPTDPRVQSPPPPPPPPPGEGRLIQGRLRIEHGAFVDDTGPRVPCVAWFADGFSHWVRGRHDYCRQYFREFREAGYNIVYGFFELESNEFWESRSGDDLTVGPGITPDYYGQLAAYYRAAQAEGLKVAHCISSLTDSLRSQSSRKAHVRELARVHFAVGEDAIAWVNVNEPNQIGADGPDEVIDFMDAYREATSGRVLTFHGAEQDEDVETIRRYARNAHGFEEHTFRAGSSEQQIHHIYSLLREQSLLERVAHNGIFSEGPGPQDPVSVGQQNNAEAVVLIRAMEACCHSPAFAFCGKGLFSKWHSESFHGVPGWSAIPRVVQLLEEFTGGELHRFGTITHVGAGDRVLETANADDHARNGVRFDQFVSHERRKAVCLLYRAHPYSVRVRSLVGGRITIVNPLTLEQHAVGDGDEVSFEQGRIILLEW